MRKNLLGKIILFVLTLCITVSFTACNGGGGNASGGESTGTGDSTSVSTSEGTSSSTPDSGSEGDNGGDEGGEDIGNEEPLVDFIVDVEEGRDIRVMQITDIQIIDGTQQRYKARIGTAWIGGNVVNKYHNYLKQVIERYDPDLILMTGDNVYGEFDDSGESLKELISFMDQFEIPWAPVMGNHDAETNMGVDWQCEQYEKSEYALFKQRELTGNGNYTVGVEQGGVLKRVFYMMDSNGYSTMSQKTISNGHSTAVPGFAQDQIDWYTASVNRLKSEHPSVKLSFCFHIPIVAFKDGVTKYGYSDSTIKNASINLDVVGEDGDFGVIGTTVGGWDSDYTVWNGLKSLGVDSIFVGHEHRNSFSVVHEGVRLTFGQKSSNYDSINYYFPSKDVISNVSPDGTTGIPLIGGTMFPLDSQTGEIKDPGIMLYDREYTGGSAPEADPGAIGIPTVDVVDEQTGSYRGNTFDRLELSSLGATAETNFKNVSFNVEKDAFSVRFKFKTSSNIDYGNVKVYFYAADGSRTDHSITIMKGSVIVCGYSLNYTFSPNTEYEIEVGALKLYNGNTGYFFMKINGELDDRWAIDELTDIGGTYFSVRTGGSQPFGSFVL